MSAPLFLGLQLVKTCKESEGRDIIVGCWRTIALDEAAGLLGVALASLIARGFDYEEAFDRARVKMITHLERNRNGNVPQYVQKFVELDPFDQSKVRQDRSGRETDVRGRMAAGLPCLVTPDNYGAV